jgi:trk system potassium uptake protein TrkH
MRILRPFAVGGDDAMASPPPTGKELQKSRATPIAVRLVASLALLVVLGTLLLFASGVGTRRPLSIREALFTATSALTGHRAFGNHPVAGSDPCGQIILLVLIEIGGVGFMAAAVVAFRLIGRNVHLMDRMALRDSLGLPDLRNIMRLVERVLLTVAVIQGVGAILLWLNWRDTLGGQIGAGRTIFYALFHSASAFCNAGFDLFSGLPAYPAGIPTDDATLLIKGVLIVLGGLGIPVLADMITYPWNHRLSLHTRITLALVAFLIVFGGVALLLSEARAGGVLAGLPWHRQVTLAFFQSVSARTAGFAGLPHFENLNAASQQVLMMLMYVGCAPASMGGGITTGTLVVLVLALWGLCPGPADRPRPGPPHSRGNRAEGRGDTDRFDPADLGLDLAASVDARHDPGPGGLRGDLSVRDLRADAGLHGRAERVRAGAHHVSDVLGAAGRAHDRARAGAAAIARPRSLSRGAGAHRIRPIAAFSGRVIVVS